MKTGVKTRFFFSFKLHIKKLKIILAFFHFFDELVFDSDAIKGEHKQPFLRLDLHDSREGIAEEFTRTNKVLNFRTTDGHNVL